MRSLQCQIQRHTQSRMDVAWRAADYTQRHRTIYALSLSCNDFPIPRAAPTEKSSLDQCVSSFQDPLWSLRQLFLGYSLQGDVGTHPNALRMLSGGKPSAELRKANWTSSATRHLHLICSPMGSHKGQHQWSPAAPTYPTGTGKKKTVTWNVPRVQATNSLSLADPQAQPCLWWWFFVSMLGRYTKLCIAL